MFRLMSISFRLITVVNLRLGSEVFPKITSLNRFQITNINMAQRSITSFFKKTPKKGDDEDGIEDIKNNQNEENEKSPQVNGNKKNNQNEENEKSPQVNGNKKYTSKRQRLDSSSSDNTQTPKKFTSSEKKKSGKRQRIESSESEQGSPTKDTSQQQIKSEKLSPIKNKKSPKNKKIKEEKIEEESPEKTNKESPESIKKESPDSIKKESPDSIKKGYSKKIKKEKKDSPERKKTDESKKNNNIKEENEIEGFIPTVSEVDYQPAKDKYHPIFDACWARGEKVPYLALAKTLEAIEATSARLKMIDILSNYLRSVIVLTPEDLLPSVYLCLNQLAPAYHSLELGIAETYLMKAVGACTGRSLAHMKAALAGCGDLGQVAQAAREAQRMLLKLPPLMLRNVFATLKEIANMSGQASVNKKISKIQGLYVACRHSEAKFLIRSLQGKLRVGLAEQSVLQALAAATARTPPQPWPPHTLDLARTLSPEAFKARVDEHALIIKTTYCECPNYELVVPTLLAHGVAELPRHCRLSPGIPLKPMLAYPTKGVAEVFQRFENVELTCEYKYDGERAQVHVPGEARPDYPSARVFSRNQEDNTSKYPDIISRLPGLLKEGVRSCVLDTEAVAYDVVNKQILPFQILSTRKRKDAAESDIKVQVCVYVFDLLYLNGEPLVKQPLARRRELLRENFNEVPGEWQMATWKDCNNLESVQEFLEAAVRDSCEGLMVKTLAGAHATYEIARRSHNWLKLKKDYLDGVGDTIDVVVIGAYHGRGRRAGRYGGFLLACYHPELEQFQSLCKIGTGFSDLQLQTFSDQLKALAIPGPRGYYRFDASHAPDEWFSPQCVWEVRCADLSLSPAHHAAIGLLAPDKGISLRFPRFVRVREDKSAEQATSAQQIADMYMSQDQVKNQTGKPALIHDDFY